MTVPPPPRPRRDDKYLLRTLPDGRRQASWRIWVLIWVTPVLFALAAAYLVIETLYKRANTVETTGTVVRVYEWESDNPFDEGPYVYGPVFRYTWTDGTETEASAGVSSSLWNYPVGTERPIRYWPDVKDDIIVVGPTEWLVARVIGWIAAITALVSVIVSLAVLAWLRRGAPAGAKSGSTG
jgi:hypothetical protein